MSWMDLSDYLVIEETAAARIDDLRGSRATGISAPAPAPAPPARVSACDWLRPASIEAP